MKVLDVINPYKAMVQEEMLEETRLSTEFTIGFELEGVCDSDDPDLEDAGFRPQYHSGHTAEGGSAALKELLNKTLNMGEGDILSISNDEIASIDDNNQIHWANSKIEKQNEGRWFIYEDKIKFLTDDENLNTGTIVGIIDGRKIDWETDILKTLGLDKIMPTNITLNRSKIESDGSLKVLDNNKTGHAWTFEWGSPIIKFNPLNIQKIHKFLTNLKNIGVYTNESCGFHTHISFDNMTRDDAKWILFCIANDDNLLDDITYLRVEGEEPIRFFGHYATDDWFNQLKVRGNLKDWSFRNSTDDKYLMIRIHPDAGTLEWRGPRNFINDGEKPELIMGYLTKLYRLVLKIAKLVDEKEYNGFKRSEVLEKMTVSGKFNTTDQKITNMTAEKLMKYIIENPSIYVTLKPSKLEKLMSVYGNDLTRMNSYPSEKREVFKEIWPKIPSANKKIIIDAAVVHSNINDIQYFALKDGKYDTVTTNILIDAYIKYHSLDGLLRNSLDKLTIEDSKVLEKIYNSDASKKLVLQVFSKFPKLISMKILTKIANSGERYVLSSFPELPVKIQRILIRKNPYNVQYINNPDQSIINELIKKYGDDIKDYILGVL